MGEFLQPWNQGADEHESTCPIRSRRPWCSAFPKTYASAFRTALGLRNTREWYRSRNTRPLRCHSRLSPRAIRVANPFIQRPKGSVPSPSHSKCR